ncbi:serine/arginine repetitive matrix protein 2 [Streptomyces sp. NPDC004788]
MSTRGGGAWWNDESQSWETDAPTTPTTPEPPKAPPPAAPDPAPGYGSGPGAAPAYGPGPGPAPAYGPGPGPAPAYGPVVPPPPPPSYLPGAVPADASAPRSGPSRNVLVAGAVVAVLVAGGVGGWFLWGRDGGSGGTGQGPTAAPSVTVSEAPSTGSDEPSASESASAPASPSEGAPPAGFRLVEDDAGFTIAVPEGWNRTTSGASVFYNAPDGASLVQVFTIDEPGLTPYEALQQTSRDLAEKNPGYQEVGLDRTGTDGKEAELVYSYDRTEGRRKVVDRAFTGSDGRQYAVLAAGPETEWPKQRETIDTALRFFKPGP